MRSNFHHLVPMLTESKFAFVICEHVILPFTSVNNKVFMCVFVNSGQKGGDRCKTEHFLAAVFILFKYNIYYLWLHACLQTLKIIISEEQLLFFSVILVNQSALH